MIDRRINLHTALFTFSRLVLNASYRIVYPFMAVFAGALNVEISVISGAMALSMATSAAGPFIAPIADRRGRKTGMLIGLAVFLVGSLAASILPNIVTFYLAILLGNLGNNIFLPAIQAYLGDHTPYSKRGFYMALTELSWALSFILFIPLAGLILEKTLWNVPFIILSILGVLMIFLIWKFIPQDRPQQVEKVAIFSDIKKVLLYPPALISMFMGMSFIIGNELINVVFGVWMQDSFGLQIAALGAASFVIGISELAGEGIAAYFADHFGKERSVILSLLLNGVWVFALPWLGKSETGAFIWLFLFYLTFEVAVVSVLPLMTEVMPKARATMMALFIAAFSIGRAIGDVLAPQLYKGGFFINGLVCLALDFIAIFLLTRIKLPDTAKD